MGTLLYKIKSDWNRCLFEREIEMQCILPSDCNTNIGILCRYYNRGTKKMHGCEMIGRADSTKLVHPMNF